jgi:5'-deoxynucleotidase YfbR-like HD superfamily hydrolase
MNNHELNELQQRSLSNDQLLKSLSLGLAGIERWKDPLYQKAGPGFSENDLQHVDEMRKILDEMKVVCPFLQREINFHTVDMMIVVHDVGEINTRDILALHRDDNNVNIKHRRQEEAASAEETIKQVVDPRMQKIALSCYDRFEKQTHPEHLTNDPEALLARFIDKLQGDIVFYNKIYQKGINLNQSEIDSVRTNIPDSLKRIFNPAFRLLKLLRNESAKEELSMLIKAASSLYIDNGFGKEFFDYLLSNST